MKVGFTGTQVGMSEKQVLAFITYITFNDISEFHHGDCIGSDKDAHELIRQYSPSTLVFIHPPRIRLKRAFCSGDVYREPLDYLVRNHNIVDEVEKLVSTTKTNEEELRSGTWATIRYARKNGVPVVILER